MQGSDADGAQAGQVREATEADFDAIVDGNHMVVVDAYATWCGPCKVYSPVFEQVAARHPDVAFVKFDVDAQPAIAQALGIQAMPTTVFFLHGQVAGAVPGALRPNQLEDLLGQLKQHHHH